MMYTRTRWSLYSKWQ